MFLLGTCPVETPSLGTGADGGKPSVAVNRHFQRVSSSFVTWDTAPRTTVRSKIASSSHVRVNSLKASSSIGSKAAAQGFALPARALSRRLKYAGGREETDGLHGISTDSDETSTSAGKAPG